MMNEYNAMTFGKLERAMGIERDQQSWEPWINEGSIPAWFHSVYDTPFGEFSNFDLCRSLRQKLYLNEIIPVAIGRCIEDPGAGDILDSEVATHVIKFGKEFFQSHPDELPRFLSIIPAAIAATYDPEDQEFLRTFLDNESAKGN